MVLSYTRVKWQPPQLTFALLASRSPQPRLLRDGFPEPETFKQLRKLLGSSFRNRLHTDFFSVVNGLIMAKQKVCAEEPHVIDSAHGQNWV
jgi:hypothetical protein